MRWWRTKGCRTWSKVKQILRLQFYWEDKSSKEFLECHRSKTRNTVATYPKITKDSIKIQSWTQIWTYPRAWIWQKEWFRETTSYPKRERIKKQGWRLSKILILRRFLINLRAHMHSFLFNDSQKLVFRDPRARINTISIEGSHRILLHLKGMGISHRRIIV